MTSSLLAVQIISVVVAAVVAAGGAAWLIGRDMSGIRETLTAFGAELKAVAKILEKDLELRDQRISVLEGQAESQAVDIRDLHTRVTKLEAREGQGDK